MNYQMQNFGKANGRWMSCDFRQAEPTGFGGLPKSESRKLAIDQWQPIQFRPEGLGSGTNFLNFDEA
jgi:hypothetical protein